MFMYVHIYRVISCPPPDRNPLCVPEVNNTYLWLMKVNIIVKKENNYAPVVAYSVLRGSPVGVKLCVDQKVLALSSQACPHPDHWLNYYSLVETNSTLEQVYEDNWCNLPYFFKHSELYRYYYVFQSVRMSITKV